ncbi:aminotransferase class I/II-fold pyridoxal phosphate-dependent enzyme [Echinicola soli]|uniref:Aminotransferase class I/II-fold pyridoxal phosphate-dependent enzyme n=1 Tax=Echinicola soli TaxID=2591634 RepID=A0A514CNS2_9BACT|nr:GntG family PLP-dependent aldolase [Echinicola soli]QDH81374.1 aminotransferase class I/II-fold pyridoxal phosphate-dependent enzyme [Echinicola soli]
MIIDLRSDTVTKPTKGMLEAMWAAEVGDDVLGEDPSVQALETRLAAMFGMEAGMFCPSGTMSNQIAIKLHAGQHKEVVCHKDSHIYLYEGGGIMANAMASVRLLDGKYGKLSAGTVEEAIQPEDVHAPMTTLVSLENTMNKGGGSVYTLGEVKAIQQVCQAHQLKLHLDGARIFNGLAATGEKAEDWGNVFDTISVCLSKGLGCPVGSVLLGDKAMIHHARRIRKSMGGGMRQVGFMAAAGIYALEHHVGRLEEDHRRAKTVAEILSAQAHTAEVFPVPTNIVIVRLAGISPKEMLAKLDEKGIRAVQFGKDMIRFVTHLDVTDDHLEAMQKRLK